MQESIVNNIPEETKRKIQNSISKSNTILHFTLVKLYICNWESTTFTDTNLGGILTITVDRCKKCLLLQIFDFYRNLIQFEIEIYKNIHETLGYKVLKEQFHSIQYPFGFIGLNFVSKIQAEKTKNLIFFHSKVYSVLNSKLLTIEPITKKISSTKLFYEKEIQEFDIINNRKIDSLEVVYFGFVIGDTKIIELTIDNVEFNSRGGNIPPLETHFKRLKSIINKELKDSMVIRTNFINVNKYVEYDEFKRKTILFNKDITFLNQTKIGGNITLDKNHMNADKE